MNGSMRLAMMARRRREPSPPPSPFRATASPPPPPPPAAAAGAVASKGREKVRLQLEQQQQPERNGSSRARRLRVRGGGPQQRNIAHSSFASSPFAQFLSSTASAASGAAQDLQQWEVLPFDTFREKCEFIVTRESRAPYLLILLTVLLAIIFAVILAVRSRSGKTATVLLAGGGARGAPAAGDTVSVVSGNRSSLFRLVPV